jgi:hypothetical protein
MEGVEFHMHRFAKSLQPLASRAHNSLIEEINASQIDI